MKRYWAPASVVAFALGILSCGGGSSPTEPTATDQCSTQGQVLFVRDTLQNIYFWYKDLKNPDPAGFNSPEAYLEAVRYKPLDSSFSYVANKAESAAFFSESQFIGIGISTQRLGTSELRIAQVFAGSPAADAGLLRGDYVLVINGKAVPDLLRTGEIDTIFGPGTAGVIVNMTWRSFADGGERSATLTKRAVTIPTVSTTQVYDLRRGPRVGYIFFRNFVTPSVAALNTAFQQLKAEGAEELILDLRYNGGGLVSVAQHLGGLIGAAATKGQVFIEFFHNDKNQSRNTSLRFEEPAAAIGFRQLVVITTRGSASASEGVINGLRPFMPVTVVGDRTFGKPVGQYGYDFCDKTLFPVAFATRNARGEGDYFDGLPADCAAPDDLDHELGDPEEASLREALEFVRTGTCTSAASAARTALGAREARFGRGQPKDGWQQLLGAH